MAYCEWLTGEWRASGQIDPSDVVRSPNEPEWKKAARGVDGQTYPWGDERPHPQRCNFGIAAKGTTPVGQYSPQGAAPMAASARRATCGSGR